MHIVSDPALTAVSQVSRKNRANKDGNEKSAMDLLRANAKLSVREMSRLLKDAGISRGKDWVSAKRFELLQENGGNLPV